MKLEHFCEENGITLSLGVPRTPAIQCLVERSNRSWKQDMKSLIINTADKNTKKAWYMQNISYHRAIKISPYEAVFGIKPNREIVEAASKSQISEKTNESGDDENVSVENEHDMEIPRKKKKSNRKPKEI